MKLLKGHTTELTIDKMAHGGQGIARLNGLVVFVRGAIPGDKVMAQVMKKKKDYAEARIAELLEPSVDRVQPPCPYSGYCGGCQWQHMKYERQLTYKKAHIREAMARIGGFAEIPVHDVIPSEDQFAYRNKMEFSFSDRRWFLPHEMEKSQIEGDFALGLHVPGTYYKVIDVEACLLQQERGNQILREVKRYVKGCGIPVYGLKSHEGFWRYLTLRHSRASDEWMVNLVTSQEKPEDVYPLADILCHGIEQIKTVVNNINQRSSVSFGEREIVLAGDGYIEDKIGEFTFQISANSFFQTNSAGARKLYQKVVDYAELKRTDRVLDLFSGTGTIPIFLANMVQFVAGIEISKSATQDAEKNCRENGIHNCHFICGDIRETLPNISYKPDVLIIDPPRPGIHKDILAQILGLSPQRIIYISCNPATMARDIGRMAQDYDLLEIQPLDMFPHTYHVEAIAKLWRRKRG